jgi:hypothetical protein
MCLTKLPYVLRLKVRPTPLGGGEAGSRKVRFMSIIIALKLVIDVALVVVETTNLVIKLRH